MKRMIYLAFSIPLFIILVAGNCRKPKETNPSTLTIQTNPVSGANQAPAPGPDFPLVVTITSGIPNAGVKIDVIARAEGATINFYTASVNTSNAANNFLITGAPLGVTSIVEVTATDLSNANNRAMATYRFSRK